MIDLKSELKISPEYVIIYLCQTHKLSQKDLARNLDLSQSFVSDMVMGRRKLNPKILKKLQRLFPNESRELWLILHKTCAQREGWNV